MEEVSSPPNKEEIPSSNNNIIYLAAAVIVVVTGFLVFNILSTRTDEAKIKAISPEVQGSNAARDGLR